MVLCAGGASYAAVYTHIFRLFRSILAAACQGETPWTPLNPFPHSFIVKRTKTVPIRFTPDEYEQICRKAEAVNLDFSKYIRQVALGQRLSPSPTEITKKTYVELSRIGHNLNQLTKAIHQANKDGRVPQPDALPLVQLHRFLQQVQLQLAGVETETDDA